MPTAFAGGAEGIALEPGADAPTLLRLAERCLARHDVERPGPAAETLLLSLLGGDRAGLYARPDPVDPDVAGEFGRALSRVAHGVPVQHVTGTQRFFDLDLVVEPGVFIPRPETEVLVEAALRLVHDVAEPVVVDVGAGTGAIALAVKRFRPDATVIGTDLSGAAVSLATRNARRCSLAVEFRLGDLLDPVEADLRRRVHLIVANPPYIETDQYDALPEAVRVDPYEALVGGTRLHRRLVAAAVGWLAPGGWLVTEIGADQGEAVRALFEPALTDVRVVADLAGRDRIVAGRRPLT